MKIAFIVDSFPDVSETFVLQQMIALLEAGHHVLIFAGVRSKDRVEHEDVFHFKLMQRVHFFYEQPRHPLSRCFKAILLFPVLFLRAPVVALRTMAFFKKEWSLDLFYQALAFSKARFFDAIICHLGPNGIVGEKMKRLGILHGRLITVFHADDIFSFVNVHGDDVYNDLFSALDWAFPISQRAKNKLLALACPPEKTKILHMGVNTKEFSFVPRYVSKDRPLQLLSVARFVEKKGLAYAIEAVALLIERGLDVDYRIIGEGPLREEFLAKVKNCGLNQHVHFLGWQSRFSVKKEMERSDFLIVPSIVATSGDEEGIPVVIMEAMALGLPVVAANSGGIAEIVHDGETGFLVPQRDAKAIADVIEQSVKDPASLDGMTSGARQLVKNEYSLSQIHGELLAMVKGKTT